MRKFLFGFLCMLLLMLSVLPCLAESFEISVNRIGMSGQNLRLVVPAKEIPADLTAADVIGGVINGEMKYLADEAGRTDLTMKDSEIVGFEPGDTNTVVVIASNDFVNVNNIDDGTAKYDCKLTVTIPDKPEVPKGSRSFQVTFLRGGNAKYARLVVPVSEIPADLKAADLKGATITGILEHNTDKALSLTLNNRIESVELKETEAVLTVEDGETFSKDLFTVGKAYTGVLTVTVSVPEGIFVKDLFSAGVNTSFCISNMTQTPITKAKAYVVAYNASGKMVDVCSQDFALEAYTATKKLEVVFEPTEPWTNGKVFLFNVEKGIEPLVDTVSFAYQDPDFAVPDYGGEDYGTVAKDDWRLDETHAGEFNIRNGAPNFWAKVEKGEEVTLAFIGGSVTQGYTWCGSLLRYFRATYPNVTFNDHNIGLSGTGTEVGVIRLSNDVFPLKPDIIFIEYGGNGGTDPQMEGMFRKIRAFDPSIDIVMVNTMHADWYQTYKSGDLPSNIKRFEKIAEHYGVPSASFGPQVVDYYDEGKLTLSGNQQDGKVLYAKDGIHPTENGGQLAGGAVVRSLIAMREVGVTEKAHTMPTAINSDNWEKASSVGFSDFDKVKFEGSWFDCLNDGSGSNYGTNYPYTGGYVTTFKKIFPVGMKGTATAGAKVTVKFKGCTVGLFEAGGQYSGQVKVTVDGVPQDKVMRLYCNYDSKPRHQIYYIDALPYGEHVVTFELDSTMPDKSALQNKNPNDTLYQKNELYVGRLVSDGEILAY
ncbi:MAG: SGNH/GDSL hydrolase family protein [Clostridia bacterium]|nr:SGNH/GDSL hydrolase family protein [Clostridia bacterium]